MGRRKSKKRIKKYERQIEGDILYIRKNICIGCTACAFTCAKKTNISVIKWNDNGRIVAPKKDTFKETGCIYCGQCTLMCPTNAINVSSFEVLNVKKALEEGKYVIAISAPAVKATLGEEFNMPIGTDVSGYFEASARKLGAKKVFNTEFGADITAIEEGTELLKRIATKEKLPLFTSCCPAWIRWVELFRPELIPNISTVKSPQQIMGAVIKTYYAKENGLDPKDIFVLSVKPCIAKAYEKDRPLMGRDGYKDIDAVLTIRQYASLLKEKGIDLKELSKEKTDNLIGNYSSGAVLLGASSGILKSTIRTVADFLGDGQEKVEKMEFNDLKGYVGIKVSDITFDKTTLKVAIISGIANASKFLNGNDWMNFDFIEVMACPGGCINGGGAPKILKFNSVNKNLCVACGLCIKNCPVGAIDEEVNGYANISREKCVGCTLCSQICRSDAITTNYLDRATNEVLKGNYIDLRKDVLFNIDKNSKLKVATDNEEISKMYKTFIGEVEGAKSKELFYTSYTDKKSELKK